MASDLDQLLSGLREAPLDPGLERMADGVFGRVAALRRFPPATQFKTGIFVALGASLLGIASNSMLPQTTSSPLASFSADSPLAPSTLLLGVR